jgi:PAS domain S-box-containing protein
MASADTPGGRGAAGAHDTALRAQNRMLAALLDALQDQVVLVGDAGQLLYANRAAAEALHEATGVAPDEIIGRDARELGLPPDFIRAVEEEQATVRRGVEVTAEVLFPSPNGGRWHEHKVSPIYRESGAIAASAVTSRDIHDRVIAQRRLQLLSKVSALVGRLDYDEVLSEIARLSIPELADWCVVGVVEGGEIRRAKVAHRDPAMAELAAELLALPPARQSRKSARDLLAGKTLLYADYADHAGDGLRKDASCQRHAEFFLQLGARSMLIVPLMVEGKAVAVIALIATAESKRRYGPVEVALAEEIARRAAPIIRSARDMTSATQAQRELAQELALRERMIGILGHDLRNPLSAVRMSTALVLGKPDLSDDVRRVVSRADSAADRMAEMIGTLLDFTEARFRGGLQIKAVSVDLLEVAQAAVEEIRAARPDRRIELAATGNVRGRWDPARMAQVVSNLVANAVTHGAKDGAVLVSMEGNPRDVLLKVKNRGPAIAPERVPLLFEPFQRAAVSDEALRSRGLGLGLFIVRQIVRAHSGLISVESSAKGGTIFTVQLPR